MSTSQPIKKPCEILGKLQVVHFYMDRGRQQLPLFFLVQFPHERGVIALNSMDVMKNDFPEVYRHTMNVMELATAFATYLQCYGPLEVATIRIGAMLHDVGKLFVPKEILFKVGTLSSSDFELIKQHAKYGYNYLLSGTPSGKTVTPFETYSFAQHVEGGYQFLLSEYPKLPDEVLAIVIQHHERVDGKGYPGGLRDNEIHPYAKLVALCDVFDAITSTRCYKRKESAGKAISCIEAGLGSQFDEALGRKFLAFIQSKEWANEQHHTA